MNDERIDMRLPHELMERLDEWRQRQVAQPSRSAAARALIEMALGRQTEARAE